VVDGVLDEPPWAAAEVGGQFVERTPHPGESAAVATSVRVLFDDDALYVGVVAVLGPGESPRGLTRTRDDPTLWSDDAITVKVDARRDRRTTVGFTVNAAGTQLDYMALDNGAVMRREWDAVWESAVVVTPEAPGRPASYTVELRLPALALGVPPRATAIGMNVTRDDNPRASTYDWAPMAPEFGAFSALHYGDVVGLDLRGARLPLALVPYSLGAYDSRLGADLAERLRGALGGDALLRVGTDTWVEATLLTDFAQVDLDDALVNLDRFPLFFPERRAFFVNGLDVFEMGVPGQVQPFYSRRIGLDARGLNVPVLGGVKVYGREGPVSFGVLDVVTGARPASPGAGRPRVSEANSAALRARLALGEGGSYVGAIGVARTGLPGSVDAPAAYGAAGVDALVRAAEGRLDAYVAAVASTREDRGASGGAAAGGALDSAAALEGGEGAAAAARVRWHGEVWQPTLTATWVGAGYAQDLGFVRRPESGRVRLDSPFVMRPPGFVRRIDVVPAAELQTDAALGRALYRKASLDLHVDFGRGWFLGYGGLLKLDVLDADFEPYPGRVARAGRYEGARLRVYGHSPYAWNPVVYTSYAVDNGYFGGTLHNAYASLGWSFGALVRLEVASDVYHVRLPDTAPLWTLAGNALLRITPSTRVQLDVLGRLDGPRGLASALVRLRWRYAPGSDLFVVWREDVGYRDGAAGALPERERSVTFKMSHRFDVGL
jgi:hypothetical protein